MTEAKVDGKSSNLVDSFAAHFHNERIGCEYNDGQ